MSKNHKITIRLILVLTSVVATFMGMQMLIMVDLRHYGTPVADTTIESTQEVSVVPNEDVAGDLPPLNIETVSSDPPTEEAAVVILEETPIKTAVPSTPTVEPTLAPTATTVPVASAPILTIIQNHVDTGTTQMILPPVAVLDSQPATVTQEATNDTSTGQYVDGEYLGNSVQAHHWGNMQVNAVIQNGQLVDVEIVQYPQSTPRSRQITSNALPRLISEAIENQSADIDIVSRATDTSVAFIASLRSALNSAEAS
jgi:uncharacterized protein with FMN-binding domain